MIDTTPISETFDGFCIDFVVQQYWKLKTIFIEKSPKYNLTNNFAVSLDLFFKQYQYILLTPHPLQWSVIILERFSNLNYIRRYLMQNLLTILLAMLICVIKNRSKFKWCSIYFRGLLKLLGVLWGAKIWNT